MSQEIRDFFNREAEGYRRRQFGMRPFHEVTDRRLRAELAGHVLCVGGMWIGADQVPVGARITVTDASIAMLLHHTSLSGASIGADALELPFNDESVDHLVYPLVLHHIADEGVSRSQALVRTALAEGRRVLRPGGKIWISDFSVSRTVYLAERLLAPATKLLLGLVRQPFLVMHTSTYYLNVLASLGFTSIDSERIRPSTATAWDTVVPVISAPWFRVPRFLYPLHPILIVGTK